MTILVEQWIMLVIRIDKQWWFISSHTLQSGSISIIDYQYNLFLIKVFSQALGCVMSILGEVPEGW